MQVYSLNVCVYAYVQSVRDDEGGKEKKNLLYSTHSVWMSGL